MITDLHERLEELAEAAASHGRTPGPEAALRRGRQRQWHLAVGRSALVALVLFTVTVAGNRLTSPAGPPAAAPTTRPAARSPSAGPAPGRPGTGAGSGRQAGSPRAWGRAPS
jgi:hypothetical protein